MTFMIAGWLRLAARYPSVTLERVAKLLVAQPFAGVESCPAAVGRPEACATRGRPLAGLKACATRSRRQFRNALSG